MGAARSFRALLPALVLFALAGLLLAGLPWRCPFLTLTGLPCPTCGLTRATRFALHGDFAAATRMHPLWPIVAPACAALGGAELVVHWRTGRWGRSFDPRVVQVALVVLGVALLLVWIARFAGAFGGPVRS
jgi:hypothetical protein